jgi:signal transduction histidine kinase
VAEWFDRLSLSGRLSLLVVLIVTVVITSVAYLQVRLFERNIDGDLVNAARLGAQSVADNLAARELPLDAPDIRDMLHDLIDAEPQIDIISIIETAPDGELRVFTSTSTEAHAEVLALAKQAMHTNALVSSRSPTLLTVTVPVPRRAGYAVAASVGLEALLQARARSARLALGFAVPAILLVTFLVQLTMRQLVSQPIGAILRTMNAAAEGDGLARATVTRRDELGAIATGLNTMLDELERFHRSLQERVDEATRDLSLRNQQLAESRDQLFTLRESLARAERVAALGQVAANVAHQAGTPLNLVSGYVQMLRDDAATPERVRSRLQTVDTQIQQVTRVLRTMLDRARPASGFEVVSVGSLIQRVREVSEPRLSRAKIGLEIGVADGLPQIRADVTQLEMAILNLVNNALEAMPAGGRLSITAVGHDGGIRVVVADTGGGIPADMLDRLFNPWVTSTPRGQGTGLGLSIVRDVVRPHGGAVFADNRDGGAHLIIDLPAATA